MEAITPGYGILENHKDVLIPIVNDLTRNHTLASLIRYVDRVYSLRLK